MDYSQWIELGATAVIAGLAIWVLYKMNISKDQIVKDQSKIITNHLHEATKTQKEDSKSRIKLATSLEKHSNSIDGLKDIIDKKIK